MEEDERSMVKGDPGERVLEELSHYKGYLCKETVSPDLNLVCCIRREGYSYAGTDYNNLTLFHSQLCSQIHSTLMGDKVDCGIGWSYRPASLCSLMGRYDNPVLFINFIPQVRDYELGLGRQLSTTTTKGKGYEGEGLSYWFKLVWHISVCPLIMEQPKGKGRIRGRGREGVWADFMS
jgi:hypothetical protein